MTSLNNLPEELLEIIQRHAVSHLQEHSSDDPNNIHRAAAWITLSSINSRHWHVVPCHTSHPLLQRVVHLSRTCSDEAPASLECIMIMSMLVLRCRWRRLVQEQPICLMLRSSWDGKQQLDVSRTVPSPGAGMRMPL
jgi:hypothetical protein